MSYYIVYLCYVRSEINLEPQVELFLKRKDKGEETDSNRRKRRDIDVEIEENRCRKRKRRRGSIDLIIFILSAILTFFIGTLIDLIILIGFGAIVSLIITAILLLIMRIIMIIIDDTD